MVKYNLNADEVEIIVQSLRHYQNKGYYGVVTASTLAKLLEKFGQNP